MADRDLVVVGFLIDPVDLGVGQGLVQLAELFDDGVLGAAQGDDVLFLPVLLELFFALLDLLLDGGDLFRQEIRGLLGGLVFFLDVHLDVGIEERVQGLGGELGVPWVKLAWTSRVLRTGRMISRPSKASMSFPRSRSRFSTPASVRRAGQPRDLRNASLLIRPDPVDRSPAKARLWRSLYWVWK